MLDKLMILVDNETLLSTLAKANDDRKMQNYDYSILFLSSLYISSHLLS